MSLKIRFMFTDLQRFKPQQDILLKGTHRLYK